MSNKELTINERVGAAVEATEAVFMPWLDAKLPIPPTSVKELIRVIRRQRPDEIITERGLVAAVATGNVVIQNGYESDYQAVLRGVKVNGQKPERVAQMVAGVDPGSRIYQIALANIQRDGQRWQRPPQFPDGNKGKLTTNRARSTAAEIQLTQAKIDFVPRETTKDQSAVISEQDRRRELKNEARWITKAESGKKWNTKQELEEADRKASRFVRFVQSDRAVMAAERPEQIRDLVRIAQLENRPLTVVNWICPQGTPLDYDPVTERLYRRFIGIEPEQGYRKDYRLVPRLDLERRLISELESTGVPFRYIKIVADDNPYTLYPASLRLDGEAETMQVIENYAQFVQAKLDQEIGPGKIEVVTMSKLLGFERFMSLVRDFGQVDIRELLANLPVSTLTTELDVLTKHTKPDPRLLPYFDIYGQEVVKQYCVEGYYLYELFGDNVVLAWNESTRRAKIVDGLRIARGLPALPKVFVLHRKKGTEIEDDF